MSTKNLSTQKPRIINCDCKQFTNLPEVFEYLPKNNIKIVQKLCQRVKI